MLQMLNNAIQKRILLQRKIRIGKYKIEVPRFYRLALNQKKYRLYDRFLPVLAETINSAQGCIVDVGANIGDSCIAMVQHCQNNIFSFEPSSVFFKYLEKNKAKLKEEDAERINIVKQLVGTGSFSGTLIQNGGTANVVTSSSKSELYLTLDDFMKDKSDVALIKSDTDGFDFDVIMSAKKIIQAAEPILFWENQIDEDFQYEGFNNMYKYLEEQQYKYVCIFDNFGNLMIENANFDTLRELNKYIYSMKKNNCTRSIFYTDILASTEKYTDIAKLAISKYKDNYINKEF